MDAVGFLVAGSLALLFLLLTVLGARGFLKVVTSRRRTDLAWASGIALAAAAMGVELVVYLGVVSSPLLEAYVFFSAAIVGVLSLGATRILRSPRVEQAYTFWTLATCALVGILSAATPLSSRMVTEGIITGNPPLVLLVVSSLVTGPATIVLVAASVLSLRRSWRWQTLLMVAGALVLGAGGTLYIASFPVALYYAEFVGIILLFLGLMSLPQPSPGPVAAASAAP